MTHDPARDPQLTELLRSADPPAPDFAALQARIVAAAAPELDARRDGHGRTRHWHRWAAPLVPLALAASLAGVLLVRGVEDAESVPVAPSAAATTAPAVSEDAAVLAVLLDLQVGDPLWSDLALQAELAGSADVAL